MTLPHIVSEETVVRRPAFPDLRTDRPATRIQRFRFCRQQRRALRRWRQVAESSARGTTVGLGYDASFCYLLAIAIRLVEHSLPELTSVPAWCEKGRDAEPRFVTLVRGFSGQKPASCTTAALITYLLASLSGATVSVVEAATLPVCVAVVAIDILDASSLNLQQSGDVQVVRSLLRLGMQLANSGITFDSFLPFEKILSGDPANAYCNMSAASKMHYRKQVEKLAKCAGTSSCNICQLALCLSRCAAVSSGVTATKAHIGFYLVDRGGMAELLSAEGRPYYRRLLEGNRGVVFALSYALFVTTLASLFAWAELNHVFNAEGFICRTAIFLSLFWIGIDEANAVLRVISFYSAQEPTVPLRLDYACGVSKECQVLVAVPTVVTNQFQIDETLASLEQQWLTINDSSVRCAALLDFEDSAIERTTLDECRMLAYARRRLVELNTKHRGGRVPHNPFYVFHRKARYSQSQSCWMGRERKRGKIEDLIALISGDVSPLYSITSADPWISGVKYVLVLDDDTRVFATTLQKLVGTLEHPLNRPAINIAARRIERGYAIAQPTAGISTPSAARSGWYRLLSLPTVSRDSLVPPRPSPPRDQCGRAIFGGKGLYHVESYRHGLVGKIPDDCVLSHDVIEGGFLPTCDVLDSVVLEEMPFAMHSVLQRSHRWTRGDVQNMCWLWSKWAKEAHFTMHWACIEKFVTDLADICLSIVLLVGVLSSPRVFELCMSLGVVLLSRDIVRALIELRGSATTGDVRPMVRTMYRGVLDLCGRVAVAGLKAAISADAFIRAMGRVLTRRRLLEWITMREQERATVRVSIPRIYALVLVIGCVAYAACCLIVGGFNVFVATLLLIWAGAATLIAYRHILDRAAPVSQTAARESTVPRGHVV